MRHRKIIKRHFRLRTKVKQRRIAKLKKIFGTFLFFLILVGFFSFIGKRIYEFLLFSNKFEIKRIEVKGLESISKEDFLNFSGVKLKDNLINTYFTKLEDRIKNNFKEIKSVKIHRKFPDTIEFVVEEREPLAWLVDKDKNQFAVDEENVLFVTKSLPENIPQIEIGKDELRRYAVFLLRDIKSKKLDLYFDILKLYNVKDKFVILLKNNTKIFWDEYIETSFDKKLYYLKKVMEDATKRFNGIEYIDLKLWREGRIVVKPKTQA